METPKNRLSVAALPESESRGNESPRDQGGSATDLEEARPPLPPRPETIDLLNEGNSFRASSTRPNLQSHATTALSLPDIAGQTNADGFVAGIGRTLLGRGLKAKASLSQLNSARASEAGDSASVASFVPNSEEGQEENLFSEFTTNGDLRGSLENIEVLGLDEYPQDGTHDEFAEEFEHIADLAEDGHNEGK